MPKVMSRRMLVPRQSVVTLAGLHLVVAALGVDLDLAVRAVEFGVGRGIADVVLAAQFVLDLIKGGAQFLLVVADFDHASAGFFRQLLHVAEAKALVPATAIGDEDDIAHGISLLRGLDGVADAQAAAFVLAVGEDDHGLATDFIFQLLVGGQVNRVIQRGTTGMGVRNRSSPHSDRASASGSAADLQLVQRTFDGSYVVGEVLIEIDVGVEVDQKGQILGTENAAQKLNAGFLLDGQHALLAWTGVDEQAQ